MLPTEAAHRHLRFCKQRTPGNKVHLKYLQAGDCDIWKQKKRTNERTQDIKWRKQKWPKMVEIKWKHHYTPNANMLVYSIIIPEHGKVVGCSESGLATANVSNIWENRSQGVKFTAKDLGKAHRYSHAQTGKYWASPFRAFTFNTEAQVRCAEV